jgi:single-stranded-DNA-specific exonuclease
VLTIPKARKIELQSVDSVKKTEMTSFLKNTFNISNEQFLNLLSEVLVKRGYEPNQELLDLLDQNPQVRQFPPVSLIKNMQEAAKIITKAFKSNTKIGVVGDYDVDGITSVAQVVLLARTLGKENLLSWKIPNRFQDGYGISRQIAEDLVNKGVKLVVLLDHGVKSNQVIEYLNSKNIEVVVVDHHAVGDTLPNALLVDPEQSSCLFKDFKLCASGLTSFLVNEILSNFKMPRSSLGLAALGTICDVVPLDNYVNRNIVKIGLNEIRSSSNHGISQLAEILKIDHRRITSSDLAFYIGPAINAAGRLADGSLCVELLTTTDPIRCHQIACDLLALNNSRKEIEKAGFLLAEKKLIESRKANSIVLADESFHSGVVGLIAGKQANRQGVPTAIIYKAEENSVGSVRQGDGNFNVVEALINVSAQSDYVVKAGGHTAAGGLTLKTDRIESFLQDFEEEYLRQVPSQSEALIVKPDFEIDLQDVNEKLFNFLGGYLEPCGQGFEQVKFYVSDVEVIAINEKNATAWVKLKKDDKEISGYIGLERWDRSIQVGDCINLVARPMMIFRNQKHTVQLAIVDYEKTSTVGSINLRKEQIKEYQSVFKTPETVIEEEVLDRINPPKLKQEFLFDKDNTVLSESMIKAPKRKSQDRLISTQIVEENRIFPTGYLYQELEKKDFDPLGSSSQEHLTQLQLKEQFIKQFGLHNLNPNAFSYRFNQEEATRYINDHGGSILLDGPTGSGKTEIAFYIASRELYKHNNVLFVAPNHEIANQTLSRAKNLFLPASVNLMKISGENSSRERRNMYLDKANTFFIGVPHAIVNDFKSGVLQTWPWSLLIIDEIQFKRGDYAYTDLIEYAKRNNCQILGLTGTPVEPDLRNKNSDIWHELENLLSSMGEGASYYILGNQRHSNKIKPLYCIDSEKFASTRKLLLKCVEEKRDYLRRKFLELAVDENFIKNLNKITGKNALKLSTAFEIQKSNIHELFNNSNDPELKRLRTDIYYLQLLGETDKRLRNDGIYSCLIDLVENFTKIHFPIKDKAPFYIQNFFNNRHIKEMLALLSFGTFFAIWTKDGLAKALNINSKEWTELSQRNRSKKLNSALKLFKESARKELVKYNYVNHPKDTALLRTIRSKRNQQGIVFVNEVKQVEFLVDFINAKSEDGIRAVSLVGKSNKSSNNNEALNLFKTKEAHILVCTSVGNQGIDIPNVDYGVAYNFTTSMIEAMQRAGRIGRGNREGDFYMMVGSVEDVGKYCSVISKILAETKRRNEARQELLDNITETKQNTLFDL